MGCGGQQESDACRVWIEADKQRVTVGDNLSVVIRVDPGQNGISAGETELTFNPKIVRVIDIQAGDLLGTQPLVGSKRIDNELGNITYALARIGKTTSPTDEGTFATLRFEVRSDAALGTYSVTLSEVGLADSEFKSIEKIEVQDATFTVK